MCVDKVISSIIIQNLRRFLIRLLRNMRTHPRLLQESTRIRRLLLEQIMLFFVNNAHPAFDAHRLKSGSAIEETLARTHRVVEVEVYVVWIHYLVVCVM